ncbi:hypothetical protein ACFQZ4_37890 [Catellatospora coxensis]|uniref:Uncharacterized protein n=1 Tax=Catellatospora coxensis TaxID=310354 RepID=A0A8J3KRL3_9ACTN|nr:hypothetical protein [Catellatospora coxensis]GIG03659.1 hypothetical protein Cco03nite_03590 [Catellatospora coxensis]
MNSRIDQTYRDARQLLDHHRPAPGGHRCDQTRCAHETWPCTAVATARRVMATYAGPPAAPTAPDADPPAPPPAAPTGPQRADTARVWLLTTAAYQVPPTAPLAADMGNVMELLHRMGTASLAQLAVRLGRPRMVIALILRALTSCGWATDTATV